MKQILLSLALIAFSSGWLGAQPADEGAGASPPSPRQKQVKALIGEYDAARKDFSKIYQQAKTDKEREKLKYPRAEDFAGRFIALAKEAPADDAALDALSWVAGNCRQGGEFEASLDLLAGHHIASPKLARAAQSVVYSFSPKSEPWLRRVIDGSPNREVKGQATFALGRVLLADRRFPGSEARSRESAGAEAEKLFEQVASDFADVKSYRGTLADAAWGELFEIRNLAIGKVAPDIEGEDVDGNKFKLSDYRGKVVVIDFWGDW